jgi:hypothetical protein
MLDSLALVTSSGTMDGVMMTTATLERNTALLLANCGYSGQLLPSSSDAAFISSVSSMGTGGLANRIMADLWYEQ